MSDFKFVTLAGTAALCAALAAGCGAQSTSIELLGNHAVQPDCKGGDTFLTGGSLNIDQTTSYFAAFSLKNNLQASAVTVNGQQLTGTEQADVIIDKQKIHYTSTPAASFTDEEVPLLGAFEAGAGSGSFLTTNLITPAAAGVIAGGAITQLFVTISLTGHTVGGSSVTSNSVTYPISIFHGGAATCPTPGDVQQSTGACYNPGQDGVLPNCVAP